MVEVDPAIENLLSNSEAPKAPGMKYKHYAPKADMRLIKGNENDVLDYLRSKIKKADHGIAILTIDEHLKVLHSEGKNNNIKILSLGSIMDMESIAHNLFDVLRQCDELGVSEIISESFDESGIGRAIMNRLKKAAGFNIIDV